MGASCSKCPCLGNDIVDDPSNPQPPSPRDAARNPLARHDAPARSGAFVEDWIVPPQEYAIARNPLARHDARAGALVEDGIVFPQDRNLVQYSRRRRPRSQQRNPPVVQEDDAEAGGDVEFNAENINRWLADVEAEVQNAKNFMKFDDIPFYSSDEEEEIHSSQS